MKIISKLPEKDKYLFLHQKNGWYIYQDIDCSIVRLHSRIEDPFNKDVCMLFSVQNGNADSSKYPYALIIKIFPLSEENKGVPKAALARDHYKSKFSFRLGEGKVDKWFSFKSDKPNFVLDYFFNINEGK